MTDTVSYQHLVAAITKAIKESCDEHTSLEVVAQEAATAAQNHYLVRRYIPATDVQQPLCDLIAALSPHARQGEDALILRRGIELRCEVNRLVEEEEMRLPS